MIIRAITSLIFGVLNTIAKIIAWLIIAFGLWVPTIYSVAFFIVWLLIGQPPVVTLFVVGLILSTVVGLAIVLSNPKANKSRNKDKDRGIRGNLPPLRRKDERYEYEMPRYDSRDDRYYMGRDDYYDRQPREDRYYRDERRYISRSERDDYDRRAQKGDDDRRNYRQDDYDDRYRADNRSYKEDYGARNQVDNRNREPYREPSNPSPTYNSYEEEPQAYREEKYNAYEQSKPSSQFEDDRDNAYETPPSMYDNINKNDTSSNHHKDFAENNSYDNRRSSNSTPHLSYNTGYSMDMDSMKFGGNEKPLVFATRRDPKVFVYEYSDRIEMYRKTFSGMQLIHSERKERA